MTADLLPALPAEALTLAEDLHASALRDFEKAREDYTARALNLIALHFLNVAPEAKQVRLHADETPSWEVLLDGRWTSLYDLEDEARTEHNDPILADLYTVAEDAIREATPWMWASAPYVLVPFTIDADPGETVLDVCRHTGDLENATLDLERMAGRKDPRTNTPPIVF